MDYFRFMKKILLVSLVALLAGCKKKDLRSPDEYFSKAAQAEIIKQSVRYSAKLPPQATQQTKFNSTFDSYYDLASAEYDWRACAPDSDHYYYFLMTRKARSIWPAREAIGGRLKVDADNHIQDYEEIFRTWKMAEDTLNTRAFELFDLMAKGKDLTPYQSRFKGDRYIEFPDQRFVFDKKEKRWRDNELDSLRF
jgi:hypothetical protein